MTIFEFFLLYVVVPIVLNLSCFGVGWLLGVRSVIRALPLETLNALLEDEDEGEDEG